jgi:hypothetical protein
MSDKSPGKEQSAAETIGKDGTAPHKTPTADAKDALQDEQLDVSGAGYPTTISHYNTGPGG